jgi:hypothetical protein
MWILQSLENILHYQTEIENPHGQLHTSDPQFVLFHKMMYLIRQNLDHLLVGRLALDLLRDQVPPVTLLHLLGLHQQIWPVADLPRYPHITDLKFPLTWCLLLVHVDIIRPLAALLIQEAVEEAPLLSADLIPA